MIASFISSGLRRVAKHRAHAAINVLGLAIGLACCILIGLVVAHDLGYDDHFPGAERIYRISPEFLPGDPRGEDRTAGNVPAAAAALREDFPAFEHVARLWHDRALVARDDAVFYEDDFTWADANLFEIFEFDWLAGDPPRALTEPFTVVLTESLARKYFGPQDPIGETLMLENRWPLTVTGVIRDLPDDTHLAIDAIASADSGFAVLGYDYPNNWFFTAFHTYALLRPGARLEDIETRFPDFIEQHTGRGTTFKLSAMSIRDIHLHSDRTFELKPTGAISNVYTFGAIALAILFIAVVNFVNLSTARSTQRALEVGVRKAAGAERRQLVQQFLGESMLFAAVAMLLAIAIVEALLPWFGAFVGKTLSFDYLTDPELAISLVAFTIGVGVAAGSYPALYLSAFRPGHVLKGDLTRSSSASAFRNVLVVLQFSVSIGLFICTAIMFLQAKFAREIDRGFKTEQIVVLAGSPTNGFGDRWEVLRNELLGHPEITHVSAASMAPAAIGLWSSRHEGGDPAGGLTNMKRVGAGFFELHGVDVLAGRVFSEDRTADAFVLPTNESSTGSYVINALAAREFGWAPEEAVGKWFEIDFSQDFTTTVRGPIIGVVDDVFIESVHRPVVPLVYVMPPPNWGAGPSLWHASVRLTGNRLGETLDFIDARWHDLLPEQPLERSFLDQEFEAAYRAEQHQAVMFAYFSSLAIVVACLGLFGLAAFATERRAKEIGVRKVMGGTVLGITSLLTKDLTKLVGLANLVAWPAAYFTMRAWLDGFAYRIEMSPIVFIGSAALALVIATLTVGTIAARAASANPVNTLRYE
jgi:putative ABC transport system permease protein